MLHKTLANSLKDLDARQGIICAYASSFGVVDDGGDEVQRGAYAKTIAEQGPQSKQPRIKFLLEHDVSKILGVPQVLREDDFGLYFEAKLAPTPLAQDVLTLYAEGVLTEHSIGYETVEAEWDRVRGVRLLKQLRLFEISAVLWGMNPLTPVVAVKSLTDPIRLTALADRAAKLDHLLHQGNLRCETLCQSLERELTSLHAALAPVTEVERPYTIKGVLASMHVLADCLQQKGASGKTTFSLADRDEAWDGTKAHRQIVEWATKDDGSLDTSKMQSVHFWYDAASPENVTSYKLPFCYIENDKPVAVPRGIFACAAVLSGARGGADIDDVDAVKARIETYYKRMAKEFDDDSIRVPWAEKAQTTTRARTVKGTNGDIEVSADGTHAAYTGKHTHAHKTFGSQGDDVMHEHEHEHQDDAQHDHEHEKAAARSQRRKRRKALDFQTALLQVSADDTLQDEWGDSFQALVNALYSVMETACSTTDTTDAFDAQEAAEDVLKQFSATMSDLIQRSLAVDFVPMLDCDGDSFLDPDSANSDDGYKAYPKPQRMPAAPAPLRKAGRVISEGNRKIITEALDGMSEAMKMMQLHHGAIADLMRKTDPDHVREDEDWVLGDDDSANGGKNPNKSRFAPRMHPTPERHMTAATTPGIDMTVLDATLHTLRSRNAPAER